MKQSEIAKRESLANNLKSVAARFPHQEQMQWAINNGMSLFTVMKYLKGNIGSTIIAQKLFDDIVSYLQSIAA